MRKKGLLFSIVAVFLLFLIAMATAPAAWADYPERGKMFDIYHHSSPGSGPDLFVRSAADALARSGIIKSKIQVQIRPGGSSAVALNYLQSKAGDPYLLMHWTTAQLMAMNRATTTMKIQEVTWLSTLIEDSNVLLVPYASPYKSMKELLADAKANPKKISVGINSVGGSEHVMAARLERVTGVKFNITAFEFSPTELVGGHIDVAFASTTESSSHVRSKRLRALANMGKTRLPFYKDVPTLMEQGIEASFSQYRGFMGGPNFPADAVKFWDGAFAKLMTTKQFADYLKKSDTIPAYKNAADTKAFVADYNAELLKDLKFIQENK